MGVGVIGSRFVRCPGVEREECMRARGGVPMFVCLFFDGRLVDECVDTVFFDERNAAKTHAFSLSSHPSTCSSPCTP